MKAVFVGILAGLVLAWSYPAGASEAEPCYVLDMASITEETVVGTREALFALGWWSTPTDALDALYSPPCWALGV